MSEENVEVIRRLYDAVARRDTETVLSIYDPNVEWDGSQHRWAEVMGSYDLYFHGHEELRKFFRRYYESWESLEDTLDEVIDAGETVVTVVTTRGRGRGSGIEVEWKHFGGLWWVRDGKVIRNVWFTTRAEALEAAGLSE